MGQCLTTACHKSDKRSIPEVIDVRKLPHFVPMLTGGRVIKCYDGDTITIAAYLPFKESELYKFSVRINGIDCPEIKGQTANEKTCAQIARNAVEGKILHKMVKLENVSTEKYGRVLADVVIDDCSIGPWLVKQRLAVEYKGKTKVSPPDWMEYYRGTRV